MPPRFVPANTVQQAPPDPLPWEQYLPYLRAVRQAGGIANSAFGGGNATGGLTNASLDVLGLAGGIGGAISNARQGRFIPAAFSGASGAGSLARLGANLHQPGSTLGGLAGIAPNNGVAGALGTAGGVLGGLGGLAGSGMAFQQGNIPGGIASLVSGAGGLASLAPAGSAIGGVPISGAAAGSAAGTTAGATAGASIAGALGAVAAPVALGVALHPFFDKWSQPDSAYRIEERNNATMGAYARGGLESFKAAGDDLPRTLGSLYNTAYAPNEPGGTEGGAATFRVGWKDERGFMNELLLQRALAGDPDAARQLVGTLDVRIGQGGATTSNYPLTDFYRRELAHRLRLDNVDPLLPPEPPGHWANPNRLAGSILNGSAWSGNETWGNASAGFPNAGTRWAGNWRDPALLSTIDQLAGPSGLQSIRLPIGHGYGYLDVPVSQRFRAPGELTVPNATRTALTQQRDTITRDIANDDALQREYMNAQTAAL